MYFLILFIHFNLSDFARLPITFAGLIEICMFVRGPQFLQFSSWAHWFGGRKQISNLLTPLNIYSSIIGFIPTNQLFSHLTAGSFYLYLLFFFQVSWFTPCFDHSFMLSFRCFYLFHLVNFDARRLHFHTVICGYQCLAPII